MTTAMAGSFLKMKPLIHVDADGKLQTIGKVRGRKNAMKELITAMKETADIDTWNQVFISHGDCLDNAMTVREMVESEFPQAEVTISDVGPVIGAHTGPGVICLSYMGKTVKGTK